MLLWIAIFDRPDVYLDRMLVALNIEAPLIAMHEWLDGANVQPVALEQPPDPAQTAVAPSETLTPQAAYDLAPMRPSVDLPTVRTPVPQSSKRSAAVAAHEISGFRPDGSGARRRALTRPRVEARAEKRPIVRRIHQWWRDLISTAAAPALPAPVSRKEVPTYGMAGGGG